MLTQYATSTAARDRMRRREEEAAAARGVRRTGSEVQRPDRRPFRSMVAGMTTWVATRAHVRAHDGRPTLGREVHTAC